MVIRNEAELRTLAANAVQDWGQGTLVFLIGELGAGKTTFVRGAMAELGIPEGVRSPTFNLLQVFETSPPVLHADFYRVKGAAGTGIEDYFETHLCFVEWPMNAQDVLSGMPHWTVQIEFHPDGRDVQIMRPT